MRKTDSMLNSQLEILAQGHAYLEGVTKEDYSQVITPNFISSAIFFIAAVGELSISPPLKRQS